MRPAGADGAATAVLRSLASAGRGYAGGRLTLTTSGVPPRTAAQTRSVAAAQRRAAALAVTSALRGGPGTARVRVRGTGCPLATP
ncbi:hypothetical protein [Streptantibioticus silvisoli]|uniref:Uncharacterized protein n=1 Tax=Streptantibioticus silvisoli TaxID=2705255 RepID=A0ABT6VZ66_9ACTN|nr:hypothetical protein [Streptantibioticus silvisoli]MDI5963334.1 hypothetical protein [Streptantibioticus silvisoli]